MMYAIARELRQMARDTDPLSFTYPRGLIEDAHAYANRRAARELRPVHVYARGGVVFVRADYESQPEGSALIYTTTRQC